MKKYEVYSDVVNYKIVLDETNKIKSLQVGHEIPYIRDGISCEEKITDHISALEEAFLYMLVMETEKFREMYVLLKENDPEMFQYAEEIVNKIIISCLELM